MSAQPLRLAHISDVHLIDEKTRLRMRDWLSKRAVGWANSRLTRSKLFRHAPEICRHLVEQLPTRQLDGVIFTGDATTIGTPREFSMASEIFAPLLQAMPGLAVPGNHDHYMRQSVRARLFETTFASWQTGLRVDEHVYPFARQLNGIWFVCVNSSRPNLAPWDSRGKVGQVQLDRLEKLMSSLPAGPKILVTHYPYQLGNGHPELRWRKLRDARKLWDIMGKEAFFWFHGHRHVRYHLPIIGSSCVEVCVGSSTQEGRWSYHEYTFARDQLVMLHRMWNKADHRFDDVSEEIIPMPEAWQKHF
ncbi:metallophosphoesterase family protein [Zavarzinella formosa]|uniref:metallophosphoesterase family protein n=1 Tax=Zavarzinella formosa TaxID=360055 RepID=UPI000370D0BA|nr:metallophosphoesterase [Zavarzinella formosa]